MNKYVLLFHIVLLSIVVSAQTEKSSELYQIIKEKDSLLFNLGFNNCDISQFENLVSEKFEFFHDQSGITDSKSAFINSIKNGLCKLNFKPKRVLVENSLEVYPLKNNGNLYGAIETGTHHFYAIEKDSTEYLTSIAKFSHLWILENGNWKLSKGFSYDHKDFDKPVNKELLFKDRRETEKWLKQKNIPALGIGFIENGRIKQTSVFGNLEQGKPAPLNTIWNVASMTKPITAILTLTLVNQGLWSLDEPIYKYYTDPDVANDPKSKVLTTRMILSHQSGFPNWRGNSLEGKLKFEFEPGTKYQYSGEGYEYLRKALEIKFHKSLEQLAQELIFNPLEMNSTQFVWSKSIETKSFAKWHSATGELYETDKYYEANAADNLLTTVEDYSKFMLYVLNGAGLSESLQKEMIADQVRVSLFKHYGLGWWVDEKINTNDDFALVLAGDDIGVHCIAFIVPNSEKALLIFTNSDNGTDAYMEIINQYLENDAEGIIRAEMNK